MVSSHVLLFAVGLVLLVKGADYFAKSAASIAKRLGVSEFVIGLTLVAIATSIPELASSTVASLRNQSGIVLGNIIGSNVANIGLIVGITAIIGTIKIKEKMIHRDGYIMIFASALFFLFALNGIITRIESAVMLLLYISYLSFIFLKKPHPKEKYYFGRFIRYFLGFEYFITIRSRILTRQDHKRKKAGLQRKGVIDLVKSAIIKDLFIMLIALFAIFFGADYLVKEAVFFADYFKIPQTLIGISIIAVGTSLPELSISITAIRKGLSSIAFGNIIGSNISNIFFVLATSGLIRPISVDRISLIYSLPFMIAISIAMLIFAKSQLRIKAVEGTTLLILYALFMIFLFSF